MHLEIDQELRTAFNNIKLGCIEALVNVRSSDDNLKNEINDNIFGLAPKITNESIRNIPIIGTTRNAYRILGKDPSRYRPSAESLLRRVASGNTLYFVNNIVDILNLVSIKTGYSICGYDADTITGKIVFGVGRLNEPYEGIGRGMLNIENLPVFRDEKGPFGTPTSDSVRTMVTDSTKRFLMIFPSFIHDLGLSEAVDLSAEYLVKYSNAEKIIINYFD